MNAKLTELLDLAPVTGAVPDTAGRPAITYTTTIDDAFTIGPKVHGGSMQMIIARAAKSALDDLAPAATDAEKALHATDVVPVAIASDYLAAPDPGRVEVTATVLKRGRTVTLLHVDLTQNGRTMVSSSVTLARPDTGPSRHSAPHILDGVSPTPPDDAIDIDSSPVSQIMHLGSALDLALDPQTFPVMRGETGDPVVRGWCRPKDTEPDSNFTVLVCDVSPPVVMNLALFGWAPTVQLTTYIRREPAPGWLRFAASSIEVGPGMFEEDHLVVDSTGAVVAQSRQLALIPAR
ncbi:thioesterase family protein [Gordonia sp. DT30]|uniref:thioesterase family protein n=1 Tax=unclassified Gordonia (in: high G+C Gram-positive bacteria) TaxID=2657482 RepID=UPI003CEB182D